MGVRRLFALTMLIMVPVLALAPASLAQETQESVGMLSVVERWTVGTVNGNFGGRLVVRVQRHQYMGGSDEFAVVFEIPPSNQYERTRSAQIPADAVVPLIEAVTGIINQRAAILRENHEYITVAYQASRDIRVSFTRDGRDQYGAVFVETGIVFLPADTGLNRLLDVLKAAQAKLEELRAQA